VYFLSRISRPDENRILTSNEDRVFIEVRL